MSLPPLPQPRNKTGNRQKYCVECKADRKRAYYKDWYYNCGGANHLREKYEAHYEEISVKNKKRYHEGGGKARFQAYMRTPKGRMGRIKHNATVVQLRRERGVREMEEGGRRFSFRNAPTSLPYLSGAAVYGAGDFEFEAVRKGDCSLVPWLVDSMNEERMQNDR